MDEETVTYERMDGVDAGHGHKFEWEMTTLAYLRCQRLHAQWKKDNRNGIKSFSVANNVKGAENFDDIVIRVEYVVDSIVKKKVIFVQCKHIEDPSKNSKNRFETYLTEQKSLKKIFESFVKIEQCKEQVLKELTRNNKPSKNKQKIGEKDQNKLRNLFNGKNVDTEYVFYSNIAVEHAFQLGIYKLGEVSSMEDVTNILFNSSNNSTFELRLKEPVDEKSSLGSDADVKSRKQFQEKFRVFINQPEPEILIYTELQYLTETILDTENLQTFTTEEIRNHFTSKNPCTALTEKSDIVATVVNFMAIRMKSIAIMKDFCENFRIKNIFSLETTTEFQNGLEHNKINYIKTDLQKLELIKVKQVFNSIPTECTCLFLHNEIDTEQWISARDTRSYTNLKMINVCSQTNYNFDITTIKPNEVIVQISECNEQQSVLREYLHQFSEESQNFILNAIIISQGVEIDIKSFCGESWKNLFDENTICDILQKKKIKLYEPLPDLGFYIDRQLKSKTLDLEKMKRKILGWKSVNNGIILFSENDKRVPGCEATYKIFENMQDVRTFVQKFRSELQDTYHLCSYCDNEPKLIYSFGKSSALTVKNTMTQDSLLLDKHTKIKIISDVAGMGKSTTLLALAKRDKENNPSHLVFFMELNKYLERLKNAKDLSSTDAAINFLGKNILNLEEVALRVFMNACKESGKVALYFDAFDEISPDAEKALPALLLTLEKTQISRIYVSSRPNYVHVLEETMLQKSMQFVGLTVEEKERALKGFWKELLIKEERKVDESVLKSTAQKTVQLLHNVGQFLNDILAIPLQIRMLATIYYESLEGQTVELSPVNISDLYEQFIRLHTRRFYVDKHKMQWDTMQDECKRRTIEEKLRGSTEVACQTVIPELLECNDPKLTNILSSFCDDLGLITNKNPPVFLHRTIAEYLAAKYVLTKMLKFDEEEILCSILTKKRFNIVRRFINSLLVGNSAEMFCKKEIYQWGQNKTGNNPFHVASLEGNVKIMCFLLRCDQSLLNEENSIGQTAIQIACEKSKPEAVKLLLTYSDCSIKIKDHFENTLLHIAMKGGNTEIIEMILRRDKSLLNKQNKHGQAPLHYACENKNEAAVKFLLENPDCLVDLCDIYGNTGLHSAARDCSPEVIEMILRRDNSLLNKQNERGKAPLHCACGNINEAAVKFLLENPDCLVDLCDKDRDTVLHSAARRCSPEVIKMILRRDNSLLNKQNVRGKAPLHYACGNKNEAAVKFLLENPDCLVDLCGSDGNTGLHSAASLCSPEVIEMIMRRDTSLLNKQNERGKAPLHIAFEYNNTKVLNYLLSHNECVTDICDTDGNTFLHYTEIYYVVRLNHCDAINIILQHENALINKQNNDGETPLHKMISFGKTEEAKVFLAQIDCSVNICDKSNQTALHAAVLTQNFELVKMILQRENVLINQQNCKGKTPLHLAASKYYEKIRLYENKKILKYKSRLQMVKLLIAYPGCSINMRDNDGLTALDVAIEDKQQEIIEILLEHGAEYGNRTIEEDNMH